MPDNLTPVIVLGTGKHTEVVIEIIEAGGCFQILGVVSSDPNAPSRLLGYEYLGSFDIFETLDKQSKVRVVNGLGGWAEQEFRVSMFNKISELGYIFTPVIHPSATIAENVSIGEGTVIGSNVTLMPQVKIGKNVIVSSASLISHHTELEDHVLISGGAHVGADVTIKRQAIIAFSAIVGSRVEVGEKALVATGAVVIKNVTAATAVMGVPAKVVNE